MSGPAALQARCMRALDANGSTGGDAHAFFVPGRIEVLGKHTDYAGGRSLLSALERGFCIVAAPRPDARVMLHDVAGGDRVELALATDAAAPQGAQPGWATYPRTVVARLAADFPAADRGADLAFLSDLPPAAGLASSSAFVTAVFLAIAAVNRLESAPQYRADIADDEELADYLGAVESGRAYRALPGGQGVGTRGGSQDHTAILRARPRTLVQYAFRPVRFERAVSLPAGHVFAVAVSGARAEKAGAAMNRYNRMSDLARSLERLWAEETGRADVSLGSAIASAPDAADRLRSIVERKGGVETHELRCRLDHFAAETLEIIPAAGDALLRNDLAAFGAYVDRSQQFGRELLGNQIEETVHLACAARELGAVAASAFGAGFGGSVWALVGTADAEAFSARWRDDYVERFPERRATADFFTTDAGAAARALGPAPAAQPPAG